MNAIPTRILGLACAVAAVAAAPAAHAAPSPAGAVSTVRELQGYEVAVVQGVLPTPLSQLGLRSIGAQTSVDVPTKGNPRKQVVRKDGTEAASYVSLPISPAALLPAALAPGQLFDFQTQGNSAQAWATTTAAGVPHLRVVGNGEFSAEASTGWAFGYTLGGTTQKELVLNFTVPKAVLEARFEDQGKAWWRGRLRVDVLVNGHAAWSSEALLFNTYTSSTGGVTQRMNVLQGFGTMLDFNRNDEDADTTNDTAGGSPSVMAPEKPVYLSLGRFNPGQTVDVQMVVRAGAHTYSKTIGGTDHRCKSNLDTGGWFCTGATVTVLEGTSADAPKLHLMP